MQELSGPTNNSAAKKAVRKVVLWWAVRRNDFYYQTAELRKPFLLWAISKLVLNKLLVISVITHANTQGERRAPQGKGRRVYLRGVNNALHQTQEYIYAYWEKQRDHHNWLLWNKRSHPWHTERSGDWGTAACGEPARAHHLHLLLMAPCARRFGIRIILLRTFIILRDWPFLNVSFPTYTYDRQLKKQEGLSPSVNRRHRAPAGAPPPALQRRRSGPAHRRCPVPHRQLCWGGGPAPHGSRRRRVSPAP